MLIYLALKGKLPYKEISVVRKTYAALKGTAMKNFFDILNDLGLYNVRKHNKTDHTYIIGDYTFSFFGVDEPSKMRGKKHGLLWINEALPDITAEDHFQLSIRNQGMTIYDYNPSEEIHWLYDKVETLDDCIVLHSTYKDNTFLPEKQVQDIERLEVEDEVRWQIYGLGNVAHKPERIYVNWMTVKEYKATGERIYGLDFGINAPTAFYEFVYADEGIYTRMLVHESGLRNDQLIAKFKELNINSTDYVYADSEDKNRILELQAAGYNVHPADKDVKNGIDYCKRKKLFVYESPEAARELTSYSWKKTANDQVLDEPVKMNDHFCDAMRYALYSNRHNENAMSYSELNKWS